MKNIDLTNKKADLAVGLAVAIFILVGDAFKIFLIPLVGEFLGTVVAIIILSLVFAMVCRKDAKIS